jgi:diguanylate cyclase (GGDEF)-like protein
MNQPVPMEPGPSGNRLARARVAWWWFVPAFLLLHGVIATCLPERLDPLSTIFIVLAELAAMAACFRTAREAHSATRAFWFLLIAAIFFHSAAMSLDAAAEIAQTPILNHIGGLQILLSMFYDVPLLVAVSIQNDRRILLPARIILGLLSVTIGTIVYRQIFGFLTIYGSPNPSDAILIMRLFDAIDIYLAAAATLRWLGASQDQERGFFRILTIFLWIDAVFPAIHNRILVRHDYVWLDLLISAPYALLVPLVLTEHRRAIRAPSPAFSRAVRSGSPIFLAGALVLVAFFASRTHFYTGLAGALFAIAGYGALNVLVQSKGLETEESLMASKSKLEKLVDLDPLTGIANRRAFDDRLQREFATTVRTRQPVSLLMIDVDRFKDLNDTLGHTAGDENLIRIADVLRRTLARGTDLVARYGGEEFSAILPATARSGAIVAAEKLRRATADLGLVHPTAPTGILTISIGISTFDGTLPFSPADLTEAADRALYKAKRAGRNRVVFERADKSKTVLPFPAAP